MDFKEGDIFRWSWNERAIEARKTFQIVQAGALYWCLSQIFIVKDGYFVDTYWGDMSDNKKFAPEFVKETIDLEYVANINDLKEASPSDRAYYNDEDFIDIRHKNINRGGIYIRKDAKKSTEKMTKVLLRTIHFYKQLSDHYENRAVVAKQDLFRLSDNGVDNLFFNVPEGVDLSDKSYNDEELEESI